METEFAKKDRGTTLSRIKDEIIVALESQYPINQNNAIGNVVGIFLEYIDRRFDAIEKRLENIAMTKDAPACISGERITMPYSRLTDEQIVAAIDHELDMNARNDTLATDRIERLASRIEFYGRTDKVFAEKHRYWKARVAYLRHGDFPNPGIDRNGETFTAILKECADMIRPPQAKGEPIQVEAAD